MGATVRNPKMFNFEEKFLRGRPTVLTLKEKK